MKIVQINETCGNGSIGRTALEWAEYLQKNGHEAYVFYSAGKSDWKLSEKIGTPLDHKCHAFLSRLTGKQGYFSPLATARLLKRLSEIQPDVVHLRCLHGNFLHLGMLLKFLAKNKIPTVLTLHDCWFMTGKCTYYVSANCEKWQTGCNHCPLLHVDNVNPTWWLDRTRKCYQDKKRWFAAIPKLAVVGVSQWVTNEAKKSFFKDRNPIAIYNWIDTEVFCPTQDAEIREKYDIHASFVVLMVTSQVCESKGYLVLKGLAECNLPDTQIVLVGKNNLSLPIPQGVRYISHTDDSRQLAALYSMADVCVNTTRFETFGKVTAEALCCGTPVIVYNNTASPELVGPGCGYVVEEKDGLQAVANAIEEIRRNGKEAYSERCLSFASEKFSKRQGFSQYLKLYESMAGDR